MNDKTATSYDEWFEEYNKQHPDDLDPPWPQQLREKFNPGVLTDEGLCLD